MQEGVGTEIVEACLTLQRWTTDVLSAHIRMVAENKLLPKATREQRSVALRDKSSASLIGATKSAADGTVRLYKRRAAAAFNAAWSKRVSVWELVEQRSGSVDSWYTFKAGVQRYLEDQTRSAKSSLDKWQRERKASGPSVELDKVGRQLLQRLSAFGEALRETPQQAPQKFKSDGKSKRYSTHSKSLSIRSAPETWRISVMQEMPASQQLLFLIQCATGCRPQELANGVRVRLCRDGSVVTRVKGAKTTETVGQPVRGMRLSASGGIVGELAARLEVGVTVDSRDCGIAEVNTYAKGVARACVRAFPKRRDTSRLSAYSVRHQFKADLIAAGRSSTDIAKAMGHTTTRSGMAYGRGGRGGRSGVSPLAIRAMRAIKLRGAHPRSKNSALAAQKTPCAAPRGRRMKP